MTAQRPRTKIKCDIPFDEAMRIEHAERIVRPKPNADRRDTDGDEDEGPHVDRVGLVSPDN